MGAYPDTLSTATRKEYFEAYYFAYLAQEESVLRFPDFAAQKLWPWHKAYNLARLSSPLAASEYATLLSQALQQELTDPASLETWIQSQDPRLSLSVYDSQGFDDFNQILRLESVGGSATLWLTETETGFQVSPLSSDFDFSQPPRISYLWSDFTQDGKPELIIVNNAMPSEAIPLPHVFDISGDRPQALNFAPNHELTMGLGHATRWETKLPGERPVLEVSSSVYPPCPLRITHRYQWNGAWIEEIQTAYDVNPSPGLEYYCQQVVDHAVQAWGLDAVISIMEDLLPEWPPETTSTGQAYPPEEKDAWRFRLGIYHAQKGNHLKAEEYLSKVINEPSVSNSPWIEASQEFMRVVDNPEERYRVCTQTSFCDPRRSLQNWVESKSAWSFTELLSELYLSPVTVLESGRHDFNDDGRPEGWSIIQHNPAMKPEFWIFAFQSGKPYALFVDTFESNRPVLTHYVTQSGSPLIWLNRQISFSMESLPWGGFFIQTYAPSYFYADYTGQNVHDAYLALFNGFSPLKVRDDLLNLQRSFYLTCLNAFECGNFSYALGLAYELAGQKERARDTYYEIWEEYPDSPFALMARLKIDPGTIVTPTFTPSLTPTRTPTPSATPTLTPSPTQTPYPSLTLTATPTTGSAQTPPTPTEDPYP